jgi:hypothetical protein
MSKYRLINPASSSPSHTRTLNYSGVYALYSYLAFLATYALITGYDDEDSHLSIEFNEELQTLENFVKHRELKKLHNATMASTSASTSAVNLQPDMPLIEALESLQLFTVIPRLQNYDTNLRGYKLLAPKFLQAVNAVSEGPGGKEEGKKKKIGRTEVRDINAMKVKVDCLDALGNMITGCERTRIAVAKAARGLTRTCLRNIDELLSESSKIGVPDPDGEQGDIYEMNYYDVVAALNCLIILDNLTETEKCYESLEDRDKIVPSVTSLLVKLYPEVAQYLSERKSIMSAALTEVEGKDIQEDFKDLFDRVCEIYEPEMNFGGENTLPLKKGFGGVDEYLSRVSDEDEYARFFYRWNGGISVDGRALKILLNLSRHSPQLLVSAGNEDLLPMVVALCWQNHGLRHIASEIVGNVTKFMNDRVQEYGLKPANATILTPASGRLSYAEILDITPSGLLAPLISLPPGASGFYADMLSHQHSTLMSSVVVDPKDMLSTAVDLGFAYGFAATLLDLRRRGEAFADGALTKSIGQRLDTYMRGGARTSLGAGFLTVTYLAIEEVNRRVLFDGTEVGEVGSPLFAVPLVSAWFMTVIKIDVLAIALRAAPYAAIPAFMSIVGTDVLQAAGLKRNDDSTD